MSASLKPVLGRSPLSRGQAPRGMQQLGSKISELQDQYQRLLKERQQEISALLSTLDLAHLDDKTLIGGLLFIKAKTTTKDPILEAWHDAGEKFLRHTKLQPRPRVSSEKNISSKQTATPQTTPQPPRKHPREREE